MFKGVNKYPFINPVFTKEERIHIFNEKIFPQSVLISVSYDDYISLDDRNIIRKIY